MRSTLRWSSFEPRYEIRESVYDALQKKAKGGILSERRRESLPLEAGSLCLVMERLQLLLNEHCCSKSGLSEFFREYCTRGEGFLSCYCPQFIWGKALDFQSGNTPLHIICRHPEQLSLIEVVLTLLNDDPQFLLKKNAAGETPLELAVRYSSKAIVKKLIEVLGPFVVLEMVESPAKNGDTLLNEVARQRNDLMSSFVLEEIARGFLSQLDNPQAREFCVKYKSLLVNVLLDERGEYSKNLDFLKSAIGRESVLGEILWTARPMFPFLNVGGVPDSVIRVKRHVEELQTQMDERRTLR